MIKSGLCNKRNSETESKSKRSSLTRSVFARLNAVAITVNPDRFRNSLTKARPSKPEAPVMTTFRMGSPNLSLVRANNNLTNR